jgi:orotate phosphoribosyltransferase
MDSSDPRRKRLGQLFQEKAVLHGEFTLSSGNKSSYYFDGRRVTHDPEGVLLVGALVSELLEEVGVEAVGGPATAANAIVTATQMAAAQRGWPLAAFYVRSEAKQYGTGRVVEGSPPESPGARVAIVEDTITTGGSVLKAIEAVEGLGLIVAKVVVLVDRRQGGSEALRAKGYDVVALFEADENGNIV